MNIVLAVGSAYLLGGFFHKGHHLCLIPHKARCLGDLQLQKISILGSEHQYFSPPPSPRQIV